MSAPVSDNCHYRTLMLTNAKYGVEMHICYMNDPPTAYRRLQLEFDNPGAIGDFLRYFMAQTLPQHHNDCTMRGLATTFDASNPDSAIQTVIVNNQNTDAMQS